MQYRYSINKSCMTNIQNSHTYQHQAGLCKRLPACQKESLPSWRTGEKALKKVYAFKMETSPTMVIHMKETPSHSKALIIFSQMWSYSNLTGRANTCILSFAVRFIYADTANSFASCFWCFVAVSLPLSLADWNEVCLRPALPIVPCTVSFYIHV